MPACSQSHAEIAGQTADIKPLGTMDGNLHPGPLILQNLQAMHAHLTRGDFDALALPCHFVGPPAADLDRAESGRRLHDVPPEVFKSRVNGILVREWIREVDFLSFAFHIIGVGECGEIDDGVVAFVSVHEGLEMLGSLAQAEDEDSRGKWVEGSGVSGLDAPGKTSDDGDRFHGGNAGGLVEDEKPRERDRLLGWV